jgi:hypothetical protein
VKTRIGVWPLLALVCPLIVACGWVDSTGSQVLVPRTEVFLDDSPVGFTLVVDEMSQVRIAASRGSAAVDEKTYHWSSSPLEEGALATCAGLGGFSSEFAAQNLDAACTHSSSCSISFERTTRTDGVAEFLLNAPELDASIGMRFELTVQDSSGIVDTPEYDFCFVAINEAPDANDDTFVIREGIREVFSVDEKNLLSNDSDDSDVSNMGLRILTEPTIAPMFASEFELGDDGSFTYKFNREGILSDQIDTFEYALTDGVFTSKARVTLRIVASNQAPELVDDIPLLSASVGEDFVENLSLYFVDPEEGDLSFSFTDDGGLSARSGLELSSEGVLSGTPALNDVGSYQLQLLVSDGGREIEYHFALEVAELSEAESNTAPKYLDDSVFDQILFLGAPIRSVRPEFEDADGDDLVYTIFDDEDLPNGVTLDPNTGVVSGRPLSRTWVRDIRVEATDPFGASAVSDSFYIRVR